MASSLKVLGPVLLLLLWEQLVHGQGLSRFVRLHHLSPKKPFMVYKCDVLMKEIEGLKDRSSHVFIYAPWRRIYRMCYSSRLEQMKDVYVWIRKPFKILHCSKNHSSTRYTERRTYSYIEYHCSSEGYVDSIESVQPLDVIY